MLPLISPWNVTTQFWLVPLIGWKKLPTWYNQSEAQPRYGSHKASIWNFCIRPSGIILWGNWWCWCKCQLSFQARFSGNSNSQWKSPSNHQRDDDYWQLILVNYFCFLLMNSMKVKSVLHKLALTKLGNKKFICLRISDSWS